MDSTEPVYIHTLMDTKLFQTFGAVMESHILITAITSHKTFVIATLKVCSL